MGQRTWAAIATIAAVPDADPDQTDPESSPDTDTETGDIGRIGWLDRRRDLAGYRDNARIGWSAVFMMGSTLDGSTMGSSADSALVSRSQPRAASRRSRRSLADPVALGVDAALETAVRGPPAGPLLGPRRRIGQFVRHAASPGGRPVGTQDPRRTRERVTLPAAASRSSAALTSP